jgi:hypothetical protein
MDLEEQVLTGIALYWWALFGRPWPVWTGA